MKYLSLIALLIVFACSSKEKASIAEDDIEWKEMDEFHEVIADVYHPYKDSGNLEPIKTDYAKVSAAATKWKEAKLPSKVDNDETKEMLKELEGQAGVLKTQVEYKAADEEIAKLLTQLHDTFHSIMEKFYNAGKEEGAEVEEDHHEH